MCVVKTGVIIVTCNFYPLGRISHMVQSLEMTRKSFKWQGEEGCDTVQKVGHLP